MDGSIIITNRYTESDHINYHMARDASVLNKGTIPAAKCIRSKFPANPPTLLMVWEQELIMEGGSRLSLAQSGGRNSCFSDDTEPLAIAARLLQSVILNTFFNLTACDLCGIKSPTSSMIKYKKAFPSLICKFCIKTAGNVRHNELTNAEFEAMRDLHKRHTCMLSAKGTQNKLRERAIILYAMIDSLMTIPATLGRITPTWNTVGVRTPTLPYYFLAPYTDLSQWMKAVEQRWPHQHHNAETCWEDRRDGLEEAVQIFLKGSRTDKELYLFVAIPQQEEAKFSADVKIKMHSENNQSISHRMIMRTEADPREFGRHALSKILSTINLCILAKEDSMMELRQGLLTMVTTKPLTLVLPWDVETAITDENEMVTVKTLLRSNQAKGAMALTMRTVRRESKPVNKSTGVREQEYVRGRSGRMSLKPHPRDRTNERRNMRVVTDSVQFAISHTETTSTSYAHCASSDTETALRTAPTTNSFADASATTSSSDPTSTAPNDCAQCATNEERTKRVSMERFDQQSTLSIQYTNLFSPINASNENHTINALIILDEHGQPDA